MKVGFIGLGRMGQNMARRILEAGHDLKGYNRTYEKAEALAPAGATAVRSIADAVSDREVAITMLGGDDDLAQVVEGADGIAANLPRGAIHAGMGTHSVAMSRRAAAIHRDAGQLYVAAPVLGRPDAAAAGELGIVAAGPPDALAACAPLFEAMGRRCFEAGEAPEAAASVKLANNFVLGCAIETMGEAFSLVRRYGVRPETLYDVLTDGVFACTAYKVYGDIIAKEDWDRVGMTAALGLKDANLALAAAEAELVPLPSANVWRDRLLGAIAHGDGERDWAVVAREQARASGLE
ncbi:MAG: NAD(P)-dependent oxidoreductase [Defluviicoccus sp.]|nr:NAD(P)-dependent oxidoreductase [Defluviicoccus sp.]MDE0385108.1 NAD(P)-dependent oxidoreductase [Defluviicoccus sp.]